MRPMLRNGPALLLALALPALAAPPAGLPPNFRTLAEIAEEGDPDAQFFIGRHFFQRTADPAAARRARDWLTRSARQDHPHAMLLLGQLLELTGARGEDLGEALRWTARAAELGLAEAQHRLGDFHFHGRAGLQRDCARALDWYQRARAAGLDAAESSMVWAWATCPDAAHRDGRRALRLALDIVYTQGRADAEELDRLAAAFAEAGDFRSAWETQEDALERLPDSADARPLQQRLAAYRERRAWRDGE